MHCKIFVEKVGLEGQKIFLQSWHGIRFGRIHASSRKQTSCQPRQANAMPTWQVLLSPLATIVLPPSRHLSPVVTIVTVVTLFVAIELQQDSTVLLETQSQ